MTAFTSGLLLISLLQASQAVPPEALDWFRKGEELIGTPGEDSPEQAGYFERAVDLAPGFIPARYNLALGYIRQEKTEQALDQLDQLVRLSPEDPRAYVLRARLVMDEGRIDKGVEDLAAAVGLDPGNHQTWHLLGRARYQQGDYTGASDAFERVLDLRPDAFEVYFDLAAAQHSLGEREAAQENYRTYLEYFPRDFQANYLLGRLYRETGQDEPALGAFLEAESIDPDHPDLAQELGNLLLDRDDLEGARERLERSDLSLSANQANLGVIAYRQGRLSDADDYLGRAVELDYLSNAPPNAHLWTLWGNVLADQQRAAEATAAYETALRHDGQSFDALFNLARLYTDEARFGEAASLFTRALVLEPESGVTHYNLALILDQVKDRPLAEEHYLKALELGVESPHAHFRLGFLFALKNEVEKALEHLGAALEAEPGKYGPLLEEELLKIESDLDSIRYSEAFNELLEKYRAAAE